MYNLIPFTHSMLNKFLRCYTFYGFMVVSRKNIMCMYTCNIKCVSNHVRFYDNLHSDKKKKKKRTRKKYYANAKVSFPWHTLDTPSHTIVI